MNKFYFEDFNNKKLFKVLAVVVLLFFLKTYLALGVNKFIIRPFDLNNIHQSPDLDNLSLLILIGSFLWLLFIFGFKKQLPSVNSFINLILITACYSLVIRFSQLYTFTPLGYHKEIKYIDVLFLLFLCVVTDFKYYGRHQNFTSLNGFIEDDFNLERSIDILERRKFAEHLGAKILDTQPLNKAFVIAINSPWGFGKSGFLLLLEDFFDRFHKDKLTKKQFSFSLPSVYSRRQFPLLIRFNPWRNFDDKKTIQAFFNEFSASIKHDTQLSNKIKKYGNYLSKLDDSIFTKIIELSVDFFNEEETLMSLFNEINFSIERAGEKIIVFIDDLDRLTGDELIDILKLIRNTANFKNTFFIVAYDHNYVLNTISKRKLISKKEEFLQKIVQLEIALPNFQKNILLQFLDEKINQYGILRSNFGEIKSAINEILSITVLTEPKPGTSQTDSDELRDYFFRKQNNIDSLIFKVFQNIRDVVRFLNSFKLSYELIGKFGDVYEIIMLDFLKTKYLSVYQMIANGNFLKIATDQYKFDSSEFDKLLTPSTIKKFNIKFNQLLIVKTILENIFNSTRITHFRSVKNVKYFDIYFTYQAPNLISLEKIVNALKDGIEKVIEVIDESSQNGSLDDLRSFLRSQRQFVNKREFEIFLQAFFYLANYDEK